MIEERRLLTNVDYADLLGQCQCNFKPAAIFREDSQPFLDWAFWRDACGREGFASEMHRLSGIDSSALWARGRQFRNVDEAVRGADSRRVARIQAGVRNPIAHDARRSRTVLLWTTQREKRRIRGKTD